MILTRENITFVLYILVIVFIIALIHDVLKRMQLKRYKRIHIGMAENEMLSIMGSGYNVSSLKNNRKKYEWRINATSIGSYGSGTSVRSYSGVRKVDIYTKDGRVEEIRPYNV